jgi:hypothetical protein
MFLIPWPIAKFQFLRLGAHKKLSLLEAPLTRRVFQIGKLHRKDQQRGPHFFVVVFELVPYPPSPCQLAQR